MNKICPLNAGGSCLIFPVRPIACRIYHAMDPSDCELALQDDRQNLDIHQDIFSMGTGLLAGLTKGLRAARLQTRLVALKPGLRIVLDKPISMRRWLSRESALRDAEIINAKKI